MEETKEGKIWGAGIKSFINILNLLKFRMLMSHSGRDAKHVVGYMSWAQRRGLNWRDTELVLR